MGAPTVPALLITERRNIDEGLEFLKPGGGKGYLSSEYVKREGVWCKNGTVGMSNAQCIELDGAYEFCSRNGKDGMGLTLLHLGYEDPVKVQVIDVDDRYGNRDFEYREGTKVFTDKTFTKSFSGVKGYKFFRCGFEEPALDETEGVVTMDCIFPKKVLEGSERAFSHMESVGELGKSKSSVLVINWFGDKIPNIRPKRYGTVVIVYGDPEGHVGLRYGMFFVPSKFITNYRDDMEELVLASRVMNMAEKFGFTDRLPEWFIDDYRIPTPKKEKPIRARPRWHAGNTDELLNSTALLLERERKKMERYDFNPPRFNEEMERRLRKAKKELLEREAEERERREAEQRKREEEEQKRRDEETERKNEERKREETREKEAGEEKLKYPPVNE